MSRANRVDGLDWDDQPVKPEDRLDPDVYVCWQFFTFEMARKDCPNLTTDEWERFVRRYEANFANNMSADILTTLAEGIDEIREEIKEEEDDTP